MKGVQPDHMQPAKSRGAPERAVIRRQSEEITTDATDTGSTIIMFRDMDPMKHFLQQSWYIQINASEEFPYFYGFTIQL